MLEHATANKTIKHVHTQTKHSNKTTKNGGSSCDHVLMTHVTTQVLFICRVRYQVAGVKFSKRLAAGDWAEP